MAIIKNYGMFWERDQVHWGSNGNRGSLLGYRRWVRNQPEYLRDFRNQAGVYILYEGANIASQRVVYVGETGIGNQRLFHRLKQHRRDHLWNRWQRFSWFGVFDMLGTDRGGVKRDDPAKILRPSVRDALVQLEGILITLFESPKNRQGPRWTEAVQQFFQHHDGTKAADDGEDEGEDT